MKYIDSQDVEMYTQILDTLYKSVISEGGDGDAILLSTYKPISSLLPVIIMYNINNKTNWIITNPTESTPYIQWGSDQEYVYITNDKKIFDDAKFTMKIKY